MVEHSSLDSSIDSQTDDVIGRCIGDTRVHEFGRLLVMSRLRIIVGRQYHENPKERECTVAP